MLLSLRLQSLMDINIDILTDKMENGNMRDESIHRVVITSILELDFMGSNFTYEV